MQCFICKNADVDLISVGADEEETYSFRVYHCNSCDALCKEDISDNNPGQVWIPALDKLTRILYRIKPAPIHIININASLAFKDHDTLHIDKAISKPREDRPHFRTLEKKHF